MGRNPVVGRQGPEYHAATIPSEQEAGTHRGEADPLGDRPPGDDAAHACARSASGTISRP